MLMLLFYMTRFLSINYVGKNAPRAHLEHYARLFLALERQCGYTLDV